MSHLSPEALKHALNWRCAVKSFDAKKKISERDWSALEASLVLSPSSYGLQPWKFVVITNQAIKDQLPAISWNQSQPKDCSHMVVIAARRGMDEGYVQKFMDSIVATRGVPAAALKGYQDMILGNMKHAEGKHAVWNSHQTYIALGFLMLGAAALGIDTCPMEGIIKDKYDALLGLDKTEYTSSVGCALGYRAEDDKYTKMAKVRFPASEMVIRV
jgi:nitroreductase